MLVGETVLPGEGEIRYEDAPYYCPVCAAGDDEGIGDLVGMRPHQITWAKVDGRWVPLIRDCLKCGDRSVLGITLQQRVRDRRAEVRAGEVSHG